MIEDWERDRKAPAFFDFDVEIMASPQESNCYVVSVLNSPAGEIRQEVQFPFSDVELDSQLKDVKIALLKSAGDHRLALSPEETVVKDFGKVLFNTVMVGEIRGLYDSSQARAAAEQKGLRVKLRIKPPKLACLPWEFMYDPRRGEYVCLSSNTPLVRYIEVTQPVSPISIAPPLKILGMIASPLDLPQLNIGRERMRVEQSIKPLKDRGLVDLTWLEGATWQSLQRAMRTGTWHIFHFIGHGAFDRNTDEGMVCLEDADRGTDPMRATQLGRLLADHRSMRLAVLNSCEGASGGQQDIFSSTASILVRRGIPAVLAMQYDISDRAAIEFSTNFYEALADGMPVDAATCEARKAISFAMDFSLEWATPVLFMRSQDGLLFNLRRTGTPAPSLSKPDENVTKPEAVARPTPREEAHRLARERAAAEKLERERLAAAEAARQRALNPPAQAPSPPLVRRTNLPTPQAQPTPAPAPSRPFPMWLFLLGGLVFLCGALGLVIGPVIWRALAPVPPTDIPITVPPVETVLPSPVVNTEVPTNPPTATREPTASPTFTPEPPTAIIPPTGPTDPGDFVVFYWDTLLRDKNYDLGWSLLTEEYKAVNGLTKTGYDDTWSKTSSWEYSNLTAQYISSSRAIVSLTATFYYTSGRSWTPDGGLKYCVLRDENRNTWMFDARRNCGIQ